MNENQVYSLLTNSLKYPTIASAIEEMPLYEQRQLGDKITSIVVDYESTAVEDALAEVQNNVDIAVSSEQNMFVEKIEALLEQIDKWDINKLDIISELKNIIQVYDGA